MPKCSVFSNAEAREPESTIEVNDFIQGVRIGLWKDQVEKIRTLTGSERKEAKKYLKAVTLSGIFNHRKQSELISHSGFICIDVDLDVDRRILEKDPYSYAVFKSCGGTNYAVLIRIQPDKHKDSFRWIQRYYLEQYQISVDPKPSSVVSLRFVSHDPEALINLNSRVARYAKPKERKDESLPLVFTTDQIQDVINQVLDRKIDLAPDYDSYTKLAFSLSHELGESGRGAFHALCRINPKYEHTKADSLYDNALERLDLYGNPEYGDLKPITISWFYYVCKQKGINLPETNRKPIAIAALHHKEGRTPEQIAAHLVTFESIPEQLARQIAQSVSTRVDLTLKAMSKDPEGLIETCIAFIYSKWPLVRNAITRKIEVDRYGPQLTEEQVNDIYLDMKSKFNIPGITMELVTTIINSNQTPSYNPISEFIQEHYDIKPLGVIAELTDCIRTTTPMAAQWIRKWLIGMQAIIDGHPVRLMLVFTGPQYNGKTEFFRRILPRQLKAYYAESKLDRGKDDELLMCQKLVIMDDEMSGKSKQDEKRLKELTSKEEFSLRAPYAKFNSDYKRLAILCGTSNQDEVINDPTGNTRILPIYVESIDFEAINRVDRLHLFMEAYHAYKSGESWELDPDEVRALGIVSGEFSSTPFEQELILRFFSQPEPGAHVDQMTATEIKDEIEINCKQQIRNMTRLGIELRKLFGQPKIVKRNGVPARCYSVHKIQMSPVLRSNSYVTEDQDLPF